MGLGMRKGTVVFLSLCLLVCTWLIFSGAIPLRAQDVDPFYIRLLQKGESSLLAGNYKVAVSQLTTSLFGLYTDKILEAKAQIYLSLCHYYMKDVDQSRDYLSQAIDLVGEKGIAALGLTEKVASEINGLAAHFQLGEFTPPPPESIIVSKPEPDTNTAENPSGADNPESSIEELEALIEQDPANVGRFYHLYELYIEDEIRTKARQTLEKLIEAHPDEIYGLYLLGRMRFRDKKFKEAEARFRDALKPRPNVTLGDELLEELKTYHILSVYNMGDKQRALDMMSVSVHLYTEAKIRALPLSSTEKATLREIIREYMKRMPF
jgi:tetratricopeptide (TPR) repeat protein